MKTRRIILGSILAIGLAGMFQSCDGSKDSKPDGATSDGATKTLSGEESTNASDPGEMAPGASLEDMVNEYGEPCECVDQSLSSMTALLGELQAGDEVTSKYINDEMNSRLDPCMRPTKDLPNYNTLYREELIQCDQWTTLIKCMGEIQSINSAQSTLEAENDRAEGLDGAESAKDVMDKLREQR